MFVMHDGAMIRGLHGSYFRAIVLKSRREARVPRRQGRGRRLVVVMSRVSRTSRGNRTNNKVCFMSAADTKYQHTRGRGRTCPQRKEENDHHDFVSESE